MKTILTLLSLCLLACPGQTQSIGQRIAALDEPTLVGAGLDAAGRQFEAGHMLFEFQSGRLVPIKAGDQVRGVFFSGVGRFHYTSEDRYEAPFLAKNVSEGSHYKLEGSTLSDTFSSLVLYTSESRAPIADGGEWPEGATDPAVAKAFGKHRKDRIHDQFVTPESLIVQGHVEGGPQPIVFAEIGASKDDVVWQLDPLRDGLETFSVLEETESDLQVLKNRRYPNLLSSQAVGRDRLDPPPKRFKVTKLDVTLINPKGRDAEVSVHETIQAQGPLRTLDFRLENSLLGTVGPSGTYQELEYRILSLTDGAGQPLSYSHRYNQLVIELPAPIAAGAEVELNLQLAGDILYRPNNDNYWRLTAAWYPVPAYWEMEEFTYHAVVKVAKPFRPFSSGHTVRRWKEDNLECAEFEETRLMSGPAMVAGKYNTITEKSGPRVVHVSSYANKQPRAAKTLAKLALGFMEFYEPFLGKYPFSEINIIEINSLGFGQAPPGVIYITREAFEPRTDQSTRAYSEGINARIAHEVAHAWWGHVARLSTPEDQWISEAVAEYYSAVAMGALKSPREFDTALSHWLRGANDVGSNGTVYLGNFTTGDKSYRNRHRLLYQKGPVVLHALRQEVGDDPFFTILKSFIRSFPGKPARTKDFIGLSSYVAKRDLGPWFARYLFGTEMPAINK